ncbi:MULTISPECIES: hypothetical protein [Furfurilactobacillus]|nr:hypothetical protein [Furfurilactobacillus milii]
METLLAIGLLAVTTVGLVVCDVKLARCMSDTDTTVKETTEL